jgi:hypothetical protein
MALSAHDELILLRKRARRRLVGAVVLVTVSTGVLWNVVGHLPDQQMRPESVEIASEASGTPAETRCRRQSMWCQLRRPLPARWQHLPLLWQRLLHQLPSLPEPSCRQI